MSATTKKVSLQARLVSADGATMPNGSRARSEPRVGGGRIVSKSYSKIVRLDLNNTQAEEGAGFPEISKIATQVSTVGNLYTNPKFVGRCCVAIATCSDK